jgi:hypothetical protein
MTRELDEQNPYYRRMMAGSRGRFGTYLMERSFDPGMWMATALLEGKLRAASDQALSKRLSALSADEREAVLAVARKCLIAALHGLMHGLSNDEALIQIVFEGDDMAKDSDGLHGDLFWWLRDLSKYPYDVEFDLPDLGVS